jgi:hypothetical protein
MCVGAEHVFNMDLYFEYDYIIVDHLQDNKGILYIPYTNVSTIVALHPTCNPIEWELTHVDIQEFITSYPPRK